MRKPCKLNQLAIWTWIAIVSLAPMKVFAYTLHTYGPNAFDSNTAAMDVVLGISGMSIENFSDTTLIPRLSIEFQNPDWEPSTTLPANFDFAESDMWDGSPGLLNRPYQDDVPPYADTIFHISGGTSRFGVGLGDFQTRLNQTELFVNGISFGLVSSLPNYVDETRNMYLLISAAPGDPLITAVKFDNLEINDAHVFDHVAIDSTPVPIPATMLLFGTSIACLIGVGIRRKNAHMFD